MLKDTATPEDFCEKLRQCIQLSNQRNETQYELEEKRDELEEKRDELKALLVSTKNNASVATITQEDDIIKIWDVQYFDLILDRIIVSPPSTEQLITKVNKVNDEFHLFVSSVESMRAGAHGYIVCIVNEEPRPAF